MGIQRDEALRSYSSAKRPGSVFVTGTLSATPATGSVHGIGQPCVELLGRCEADGIQQCKDVNDEQVHSSATSKMVMFTN